MGTSKSINYNSKSNRHKTTSNLSCMLKNKWIWTTKKEDLVNALLSILDHIEITLVVSLQKNDLVRTDHDSYWMLLR